MELFDNISVNDTPVNATDEFNMDDAWDDNLSKVVRSVKEVKIKKSHESNDNDGNSSKIIICGAKLTEKAADRAKTSIAEKCDMYILAMHDFKTARNVSLTKSEHKKAEKGLVRLCRKTWKYKSVVGKDYLTKIYDDIGIKYRPRSGRGKVLLAIFFLNLFIMAWNTWPPKENLTVHVKDLLNSRDISSEIFFWYLAFLILLSFMVIRHFIIHRRLSNIFIALAAIAMIVIPNNFETITFGLSDTIKNQKYINFNLDKYIPINKSVSIKGEKYSISLTELDLSGQQLTSYDIRHLNYMKNLTSLILSNNQIEDISPLENLTNLETLYLDNNDISDVISLAGLTNLEVLSLESNQVSDIIPLTRLINLKTLFLHYNRIQDISPLQGLINLEELFLRDNAINDIGALTHLNNLSRLALGMNRISDISPLTDAINLYELELYSNQINDISPLKNLSNLQVLLLRNNQISDISPLKDLINLNELGIYKGNSIRSPDIRALQRLLPNVEIY